MIDLDDLALVRRLDPAGMIDRIGELGPQCRQAWRQAQEVALPKSYRQARSMVILGMGGSAIGGDLLRALVAQEAALPVLVCREYDLPAFVGPRTLVVASSYSGNTEETLSAFAQAVERGAMLVALTTGGRLAQEARRYGVPVVFIGYQAPPRAALGHSLIPLLGLMQRLGFIADKTAQAEEAAQVLDGVRAELEPGIPLARNPAKQLALRLHGRLPIVYGAGLLSEVARRWKGQFNENSKAWAFFEALPELNHNAVVGYEHPAEMASRAVIVFLDSPLLHPRVRIRYTVTQQILSRHGIEYHTVAARGQGPLAQLLSAVSFGDYVSYYLALLYGADPSPVAVIDYLKEQLAQA